MLFYVNSERIEIDNPDPRLLLSDFLRSREQGLTGTKVACGEGGCGACTVIVSRWDLAEGRTVHGPINACLRPLCALDGVRVLTIEGIQGASGGPHPIETSLAACNGSQCGMCTPGFVMNMYAMLGTQPKPGEQAVEDRFDGNLCRCTGYRSILSAMRAVRDTAVTLPDLPEELAGRGRHPASLRFEHEGLLWLRPVSLAELLALRRQYPEAQLVASNTGTGVYGPSVAAVKIDISAIPELLGIRVSDDKLSVGAATTLAGLHDAITVIVRGLRPEQTTGIVALQAQLSRMANLQIREAATVGGNLSLASSRADTARPLVSDFDTALTGLGGTVTVVANDGTARVIAVDELKPVHGLITQIHVPLSQAGEFIRTYKVAARPQNAHALVSAGLNVRISKAGLVESARVAFGGIAPRAIRAVKTEIFLLGKPWNEKTLQGALTALASDVTAQIRALEDTAFLPAGYRESVAESLLYRYFLEVAKTLEPGSVDPRNVSGAEQATRPLSQAQQYVPGNEATPPVGEPVENLFASLQTTGKAKYTQDLPLPVHGYHGAVVLSARSRAAFSWQGGVEAVKAELRAQFPRTKGLITVADVPGSNLQGLGGDEPVFADKEVICNGQLVAVVLAPHQLDAEAAAAFVASRIDYADIPGRPPILSIDAALALPNGAGIFPDTAQAQHVPNIIRSGSNRAWLTNPTHPVAGAYLVAGEQRVSAQAHFYMETQSCLAIPDENEAIVLYASTQNPASDQGTVASMLGIPASHVQVCVRRLGGGFGGKQTRASLLSGAVSVAAHACGRPVRVSLPREQDMAWSGKRHPFQGKYQLSYNGDGMLLAMKTELVSDGGCSYDISFPIMDLAQQNADGCYFIPTFETTGNVARTNLPSSTAFRSFGVVQSTLIHEEAMERVAHELGVWPEQIRRKNMYQTGSLESYQRTHYGQALTYCIIRELWDHAYSDCDFHSRHEAIDEFNRANRWRKRGMAMVPVKYGIGYQPRFLDQAGALVNIYSADGSVLIQHGGVEMGQGLATKMVQVAAEALGIPMDMIRAGDVLTSVVPNTSPTAGSTGSDLNGGAVQMACETLRRRLEKVCVDQKIKGWQTNWQQLWKEIVSKAYLNRVDLSAEAHYNVPGLQDVESTHQYGRAFHYFVYSAACVETEIDVLTGYTVIRRADIYYDAGDSLNPLIDIGQLEGGFVQGSGLMLGEQLMVDSTGRLISNGTWDYKIPSIQCIPLDFRISLYRGNRFDPVSGKPLDHQAVHHSRGIGEPGLVTSVATFFAVKQAILAARQEQGETGWFEMEAPATVARVQHYCAIKNGNRRLQ